MLERASSAPQDNERLPAGRQGLAERRRTRRRRGRIAFGILLCLLLGALAWGLQQSAVRISNIVVYGADASLASYAKEAMRGSYFGVVPRDSSFFFPASRIRSAILAAHPDIAAVSIFRNGLTGISIKPNERVAIARWCGLSPTDFSADPANGHGADEYCYAFDASGYLFAAAATTTQTLNTFVFYAPLAGDAMEPLRASIAQTDRIPSMFDFARQLDTLGSSVIRVVLRGDEVDDILTSGTRVTYLLGQEQNAFTALVSARDNLNLEDGSLDYVDLRFDGKVYLKKK